MWFALALISPAPAVQTAPASDPTWMVDRWSQVDGLPLDHLNDLAIDADGFLWITTFDGLARFDGAGFTVLRREQLPALATNRIIAARADGASVWLTDELEHVWRLDPRTLAMTPSPVGARALVGEGGLFGVGARALVRPADGAVLFEAPEHIDGVDVDADGWAARTTTGLWTSDGARWDLPLTPDARVDVPPVRTEDGVWVYAGGRVHLATDAPRAVPWASPSPVCAMWRDGRGGVRALADDGVWEVRPAGLAPVGPRVSGPCQAAIAVRDGVLWHIHGEVLHRDGVPLVHVGPGVQAVRADASGAWVASHQGLYRVRRAVGRTLLGTPDGPRVVVDVVGATASGEVWASVDKRPCRVAPALACVDEPDTGLSLRVVGSPTLVVRHQLGQLSVDGLAPVDGPPGAWFDPGAWWTDPGGARWALARDATWRRVPGGAWEALRTADGGPVAGARHVVPLPSGIVVLVPGVGALVGEVDRLVPLRGLPSVDLRGALWDEGILWLGTEDAGLCAVDLRVEADVTRAPLRCVAADDGLGDHNVHHVVRDADDRLWLGTNRGVIVARRADVLARMDGGEPFAALRLGERDGMARRELNGGQWSVARTADGRLWLPSMGGVVVMDPAALPPPSPLTVRLTAVEPASAALGPEEALTVAWSAAELTRPEQVQYRVRVVGMDERWRVQTERTARWARLPPGRLRVEVQARTWGDWGPVASVEVTRAPLFTETAGFTVALVGAGAALPLLGAWWWGRARQRRTAWLEGEVARRTAELQEQAARLAESSRRLADVDAAKTRFVANLSHELRTPLMLVMAPLHDLAAERDDPRLALAARNADRLKDLVDQLFDVVRLDAGRVRVRARRHAIGAVITDLVARFAPAAAAAEVALAARVEDDPWVWFDEDLIDKALGNLISNALKFTPAGGRIEVGVARRGDEIEVLVADTGPGVPPDVGERVFERYVQADPARGDGAGIGLALARELVELHGGSLALAPGPGGRFALRLPLGTSHLALDDIALTPHAEAPEIAPPTPRTGRPRVLVVEDHADLRGWLVGQLGVAFDVEAVADGAAALARWGGVDLVLSDVMMPGVDGLTLCRAIRAAGGTLPVVLLSAKGPGGHDEAMAAGATRFLAKPIATRALLAALRELAPAASEASPGPADAVGPKEGRFGLGDGVGAGASLVGPPDRVADGGSPDGAGAGPEGAPGVLIAAVDRALLDRLEAWVAEHLADPDLSVERLAKVAAMSPRTLQRTLQRLTGQSPVAWLQERRLDAGREVLREGRSVGEAAAAVGLSASYFTRAYTAWFGYPPSREPRRPAG